MPVDKSGESQLDKFNQAVPQPETDGQLSEKLSIHFDSIKFAALGLQDDGLAYVTMSAPVPVEASMGREYFLQALASS